MRNLLLLLLCLIFPEFLLAQTPLTYVPAPPDNPLKGLVPYAGADADRFPHSMEFSYLPLSDLMTGPNDFDWQPLDTLLDEIASRRHQAVFRIWMEYPGHEEGIPPFLERDGLKVTEWRNENTAPRPAKRIRTPDYNDPQLRTALQTFIAALGKRYDGDPRIGFITAGLLGTWGEWHTHPRSELMASKEVQTEVMQAYESAFRLTPVLLRYPAGNDSQSYAANNNRRFGYHDDSFAWATLDTGRSGGDWFFMPSLKAAGSDAMNKWKTSPIGGEIRPEIWGQIFDASPSHPKAQDFASCVQATHVSWLMDTGMFREEASPKRKANAIRQVQKMGYEFHIVSAQQRKNRSGGLEIILRVRNSGVAPFYHPWKVELVLVQDGKLGKRIEVDWSIAGLLPNDTIRTWSVELPADRTADLAQGLALRIANPLPNGIPLRFANEYAADAPPGWWLVPVSP